VSEYIKILSTKLFIITDSELYIGDIEA